MSTVYVAMINDRHVDPEPHVFTTAEKAIDFARKTAGEYCHRPEDLKEEHVHGWLYYARYSVESDCVWVLERTVDAT